MKINKYIYWICCFAWVLCAHFANASEIIPNQYIVVFKDQQVNDPQLVGQVGTAHVESTIAQSGESVQSAAGRLMNEARQNQLQRCERYKRCSIYSG